jgi:hypothetical protein
MLLFDLLFFVVQISKKKAVKSDSFRYYFSAFFVVFFAAGFFSAAAFGAAAFFAAGFFSAGASAFFAVSFLAAGFTAGVEDFFLRVFPYEPIARLPFAVFLSPLPIILNVLNCILE